MFFTCHSPRGFFSLPPDLCRYPYHISPPPAGAQLDADGICSSYEMMHHCITGNGTLKSSCHWLRYLRHIPKNKGNTGTLNVSASLLQKHAEGPYFLSSPKSKIGQTLRGPLFPPRRSVWQQIDRKEHRRKRIRKGGGDTGTLLDKDTGTVP